MTDDMKGIYILKNRDKLYKLYAKLPGSLYHVRFHGYEYINQDTGKKEIRYLQDFDIVLLGYLKLNSDMRNPFKNEGKGYGTGMTHWYSAQSISDSSRQYPVSISDSNKTNPPAWSPSKVLRSLKRLTEAGFLTEQDNANTLRKSRMKDPLASPSKREKVESQLIESNWIEKD